MAQNKKFIKNLLIIFGLVALFGFFAYSLIEYQRSGIAQDGVIACANGKCFWSAHIHVYIPVQICGEKYVLSKFAGPLTGPHTHGGENVIHWHDKVLFDKEKKQLLESSPFALSLIIKAFELPITDPLRRSSSEAGESLLGKKDGDMCHNTASIWKVFVNGVFLSDWRNYEWRDRDIVLFVFDARTVEAVEGELRQNSIKFPSVGEG